MRQYRLLQHRPQGRVDSPPCLEVSGAHTFIRFRWLLRFMAVGMLSLFLLFGGGAWAIGGGPDWVNKGAGWLEEHQDDFCFSIDLRKESRRIHMKLQFYGTAYIVRKVKSGGEWVDEVKTLSEEEYNEKWVRHDCGDGHQLYVVVVGRRLDGLYVDDNGNDGDIVGGFFGALPDRCKSVGVFHRNYVTSETYDQLFSTLPYRADDAYDKSYFYTSQDMKLSAGASSCHTGIAERKGWQVCKNAEDSPVEYSGNPGSSYYDHYLMLIGHISNVTLGSFPANVDVRGPEQEGYSEGHTGSSKYYGCFIVYGDKLKKCRVWITPKGKMPTQVEAHGLSELVELDKPYTRKCRVSHCAGLKTFVGRGSSSTVISKCSKLETLRCSKKTSSLVVEDCERLKSISLEALGDSPKFKNLVALRTLDLGRLQAKALDLQQGLPYLETLRLTSCPLEEIDLSGLKRFRTLNLDGCTAPQLKSLDISGTLVRKVDVKLFPKLEKLNLSGCENLRYLDCHGAKIKTISIPPESTLLYHINVEGCKLSSGQLDVTPFKNLQYLNIAKSICQTLKCSTNSKLQELHCQRTNIKSLVLPKGNLRILDCSYTRLEGQLDLSGQKALRSFNAKLSPLTGIKGTETLVNLKEMNLFDCYKLESLLVNGMVKVKRIDLEKTRLSGKALNELYCSLPDRAKGDKAELNLTYSEHITESDWRLAKAKNWKISYVSEGSGYVEYECGQRDLPLKLAGHTVNTTNCKDLSVLPGVTGKVVYDRATMTLTLENATIKNPSTAANTCGLENIAIEGLTIRLKGVNRIEGYDPIKIAYHTEILGDGPEDKLFLKGIFSIGYVVGADYENALSIRNCKVVGVTDGLFGLTGDGRNEALYVTNAQVDLLGKKGANPLALFKKFDLTNCTIVEPEGAYWDCNLDKVVDSIGRPVQSRMSIKPSESNIAVRGISLRRKTLYALPGHSFRLSYDIAPRDAGNQSVSWEVADGTLVESYAAGRFTARPGNISGTTWIKVISEDGGYSDSCKVIVQKDIMPTSFDIAQHEKTLEVGDRFKLNILVEPKDAGADIGWRITPDDILVRVGNELRAVKEGVADVKVSCSGFDSQVCKVTVVPWGTAHVESVALDNTTLTLKPMEHATLSPLFTPANVKYRKVTWESSDESVATVKDGEVTGLKVGTATITVTTVDGEKTAECQVTVEGKPGEGAIPVLGISLDQTELNLSLGEKATLKAIITPENATNTSVSWESSDRTVATVADGEVTGLKVGTATITVTSEDGGKTAQCQVAVSKESEGHVNPTSVDVSTRGFLAIAPNPVRNSLEVLGLARKGIARIYRMDGQLVRTQRIEPNTRIDVHSLPGGIYLLRVDAQSVHFVKK